MRAKLLITILAISAAAVLALGNRVVNRQAGAPSTYSPVAVVFDGANDYLSASGLTGASDAKQFTAAFAVKRTALSGGTFPRLFGGTVDGLTRWSVGFETDDTLYVEAKNAAGTTIGYYKTSIALTTLNQWYTILISYDLSDTSKRHLYVDDVDRLGAVSTYTDASVDFTNDNVSVGARGSDGNFKFAGEIADLWIDVGRYVDFSIEAHRRLFFDATNCLVDKGSDGSGPFGAAPLVFLSGAEPDWHTNKGTGGGFSEAGALAEGTAPCGQSLLGGSPSFIITGLAIDTTADTFAAASCDNWPFVTGHDGTIKTCYGDGDPINGNNGDYEPIGFAQLGASYNAGAFSFTAISGGTGFDEPTLDGVSGDSANGARGKSYALMRVGTTYYALVGEQPDFPTDRVDQFHNVHLWKTADLVDWTRAGDVIWPASESAARNYAWKLPSAVGGANESPGYGGYFYFISAGETANPGSTGDGSFLSSDDLMLVRCPATGTDIETLANWEYFAGLDVDGDPTWSTTFANWAPIPGLSGTENCHWVCFMDYFAAIDRFILWRNTRANDSLDPTVATALEVLEAPTPWGPWTQIFASDPWMPANATATNRYIFTWTVPHLWDSPLNIIGNTWTLDFVVAYSGRRETLDGRFDALMTTTAQLSGTVSRP